MAKVCFCADDYAFNAAVNDGIIALAEKQLLQATSCMTQSPTWQADAERLKPLQQTLDIGLHFNLTHAFSADTFALPLGQLMLKAWTRQLSKQAILNSLTQQWDLFVAVMGRQPDYIDGHQHVHQFPVVRQVLVEFLAAKQFSGWVRDLSHTRPTAGHYLKSKLLGLLGAPALRRLCKQQHFKQNLQFAGIYDFSQSDYAALMQGWLTQAKDGLLLMCHPALAGTHVDVIAAARKHEFDYFMSEQFTKTRQQYQIEPIRMSAI